MCKLWIENYKNIIRKNDLLIWFHEVLNPLPVFKLWYSNIIDLIYVMVKECRFSADDILNKLAFYEVFSLYKKFEEEVEEKNKQQKEENEKMEALMAEMRRGMNKNTSLLNYNTNSILMPKMPNIPNF